MEQKYSPYQHFKITCKNFSQNLNHQNFPFPWTLMIHITKNPSTAKVYQKLVRSCKHFFIKNSIIVTEFLNYDSSSVCDFSSRTFHQKYFKDIPHKIWITRELRNRYDPDRIPVSKLIPRIYRCDITLLELEYQIISYNDLQFLAAKVQKCRLDGAVVKYNNGNIVAFEKVFKLFPYLIELYW